MASTIDPSSVISLSELKLALRVSNYDEDAEITRKLASAVSECANFLNSDIPQKDDSTVPADLVNGIVLIVQADYEGDPLKRDTIRKAAERLWYPYRLKVGI